MGNNDLKIARQKKSHGICLDESPIPKSATIAPSSCFVAHRKVRLNRQFGLLNWCESHWSVIVADHESLWTNRYPLTQPHFDLLHSPFCCISHFKHIYLHQHQNRSGPEWRPKKRAKRIQCLKNVYAAKERRVHDTNRQVTYWSNKVDLTFIFKD